MIGPASGSSATDSGCGSGAGDGTDDVAADDPCDVLFQSSKRRAIEELDFESICEEVCGHPHKRPRLLESDLLHADPASVFFGHHHDVATLQNGTLCEEAFDVLSEPCHRHEHFHEVAADGTLTRLEVLVVDSTWDQTLESLEASEATVTLSSTQPYEELTPIEHSEIDNFPNFQDSFWSGNQSLSSQTQSQPSQQQQQQQQQQSHHQNQHQPQQNQTTMPKVHGSSLGNDSSGRVRFGVPSLPNNNSGPVYEDQENGNLSWLLDFKLDSFIEAHEDHRSAIPFFGNKAKSNGNRISSYESSSRRTTADWDSTAVAGIRYDGSGGGGIGIGGGGTATSSPTSCANDFSMDNRNARCGLGVPKKPPFTYTELIEHALQERGELTVSAIYQWISEHFPYYKSNDDRWKNSVRHNLSINPHFRKGSKAPHGAGHLWAIASQDEGKSRQLFNIATIRQALKNEEAAKLSESNFCISNRHTITIDEVAAATASIAQPIEEDALVDSISLEHCAEQILSGIKKEVEVQYLVPMMAASNGTEIPNNQTCSSSNSGQPDPLCPTEDTDFLNPVSKEIVAEECGLIGEGYLVTDLNPSSLGLNMAESEVVSSDNLFDEELSFQFYEFASPSQLQSA